MLELKQFQRKVMQISPQDDVGVALVDLQAGEEITLAGRTLQLTTNVAAKHKFALKDFAPGHQMIMYGTVVGEAVGAIPRGATVTTANTRHRGASFARKHISYAWEVPDVVKWRGRTFPGFHRSDGRVGTRNYWLVVPLVFCENNNILALRRAFAKELGDTAPEPYDQYVAELARAYREGGEEKIKTYLVPEIREVEKSSRLFPNLDGVKFLTHEMGCGGTRADARTLCGLLAGYICHPNVAGATILSLGCQNSEVSILHEEIRKRGAHFDKPLLIFDQQRSNVESSMLTAAIRETFAGLAKANELTRTPAPISALTIGLKCGGSDGFSGLSANPAIGHVSDMLAALGGKSILSEFPELCGVEQNLIDRCTSDEAAARFISLMKTYAARAEAVGSGFDMNPSPGNIRDGLITDAMKSAGAARKGGASPVSDVLDYPETATKSGLTLLCTPGNDVEAVTAQVGAGANVVLFTTGLGTPTGNPIAPVMKIATNTELARRMHDIIDVDTGGIIRGEKTIEEMGEELLEEILRVAAGEVWTKAEVKVQEDFIPWKRGVSL
jgi:altronate hydrolase